MDWLAIVIIGVATGAVATYFAERRAVPTGAFSTLVLGIFGALFGRWGYIQFSGNMAEIQNHTLSPQSVLCAVLSSVILVIAMHMMNKFLLKHH